MIARRLLSYVTPEVLDTSDQLKDMLGEVGAARRGTARWPTATCGAAGAWRPTFHGTNEHIEALGTRGRVVRLSWMNVETDAL